MGLAVINLRTKYKDMKGNTKSGILGGLGVRGDPVTGDVTIW